MLADVEDKNLIRNEFFNDCVSLNTVSLIRRKRDKRKE